MNTTLMNKVFNTVLTDIEADRAAIPRIPSHVIMIDRCVRDENKSMKDLARLIEGEPSLSARVLQVANSPFYGSVTKVNTLQNAISRLGMLMVRNIVMALSVRDVFKSPNTYINDKLHGLWIDSVEVAATATILARKLRKDVDVVMLGGIIHNVGYLAVVGYWFTHGQRAGEDQNALFEQIAPMLNCSLGGTVLTEWKFPIELTDIAQKHCDPTSVDPVNVHPVDMIIIAKEFLRVQRGELTDVQFNDMVSTNKVNLTYQQMQEFLTESKELCDDIKHQFN
jgi:HD-like signal output (HDOD) protein